MFRREYDPARDNEKNSEMTMATAAADFSPERREQRTRVLMRGTLFAPTGASVIWIRDISNEGALVQSDDPLPSGCDVIFKRGQIFAAAHVAWAKGKNAGIEFYRPLGNTELESAHLPLPHRDD